MRVVLAVATAMRAPRLIDIDSTNAQIFAQAWASGNGPLAVVLGSPDYVLCVGAVVSREL